MVNYAMKDGKLLVKEEAIPVMAEYDVVVVGGGVAGVGAGLAAARAGKKTIIIEVTSALGGLVTMGLVNIPLDFVSGIGSEMFRELEKVNALWHRNSDPEKHKLVLDRMLRQYGCDSLLVTPVVDAIVEGNAVRGVVVHTKTGRQAILGKRFVDASGDSDLVYFAGGECECGREEDNISMGCSLEFVLGGVDWEAYLNSSLKAEDPKWIRTIAEALEAGDLPYEIDNHINWMTHIPGRPQHCGKDEVSICFAHSRFCRPTDNRDLTRMYIEGREQVDILTNFIKKRIPGFENSYLIYTGSLLGVRESRRIVGVDRFTGMDIAYARKKDDVIAVSQHGFDLHGIECAGNIKWFKGTLPDGREAYIGNRAGFGSQFPPDDGLPQVNMSELIPDGQYFYDIPYGAMLPVRLDNVLAAGRNLSSDIYGQSGCRLIMLCMTLGEAAGTASAMSLDAGVTPRALDVASLQRQLAQNDVNIGQGFREIPALRDVKADFSHHKVTYINRNG
ncbi:MAG: FAD-dependent oxidoreductase [Clostridiales bacterium]|nr:FAD-dependent oxidoreductase [Clostridiales bacterium]